MAKYPGMAPERHAAAKEAFDLQEAEKGADRLLLPPVTPVDAANLGQPTEGEFAPTPGPADDPSIPERVEKGYEAMDTAYRQQGLGAPWGPREDHMTRDRADLPLPQMSLKELEDARQRLVSAMATEPSGSQADAYSVLLTRINRAIAEQETPAVPEEDPEFFKRTLDQAYPRVKEEDPECFKRTLDQAYPQYKEEGVE